MAHPLQGCPSQLGLLAVEPQYTPATATVTERLTLDATAATRRQDTTLVQLNGKSALDSDATRWPY
jgi:hypothetical protein